MELRGGCESRCAERGRRLFDQEECWIGDEKVDAYVLHKKAYHIRESNEAKAQRTELAK